MKFNEILSLIGIFITLGGALIALAAFLYIQIRELKTDIHTRTGELKTDIREVQN